MCSETLCPIQDHTDFLLFSFRSLTVLVIRLGQDITMDSSRQSENKMKKGRTLKGEGRRVLRKSSLFSKFFSRFSLWTNEKCFNSIYEETMPVQSDEDLILTLFG